ncbi:phosphatidylserine decarboxylase [Gilliamella sp. Fer4-1]
MQLTKGQDMGCFKLGSTVITLFASNAIEFESYLKVGDVTRVGRKLANRI